MDPFTIISLAKGIMSATGLDDKAEAWIGDKIGVKAAEKITSIAGAVVGHADAGAMSAEERALVRAEIEKSESEIRRLAQEDLNSARAMYADADHTMADNVAHSVIRYNLWVVAALVAVNVAVIIYVDNPTIAVAVGNIIGASISYLWQERQAVIGFFFGSSHGSKTKTRMLEQNPR